MTTSQPAAIDTNVLVALVDSRDQWHATAQALREALKARAAGLVFHDAMIAPGCKELGIAIVASFDQDFDQVTWLTRVETPDAVMTAFKQAAGD